MSDIPNKDYTVNRIQEWFDSTDFLRQLYKNIKQQKWEEYLYDYFSQVHDELFTDLLLKKTYISNSTKKMLEILSTPVYIKSREEKEKIYKKVEKL